MALLYISILAISSMYPVVVSSRDGYTRLVIIYMPYANPSEVIYVSSKYNLSTIYMEIKLDLNTSHDYYLYWITTGLRPRDINVTLLELEPAEINQSRILSLWGNATIIDIPIVDPGIHTAAINPYIRRELVIPPALIKIPINGSIYWKELDTNISSLYVDQSLEITLETYNVKLTTRNISEIRVLGPRSINLTRGGETYTYWFTMYIQDITSEHVALFTPGAIPSSGYISASFKPIEGARTHWRVLYEYYDDLGKDLANDTIQWWFNETAITSQLFLLRSLSDVDNTITILYIPHISIAKRYVKGDYLTLLEKYIHDLLISITTKLLEMDPDYLITYISPGEERVYVVFTSPRLHSDIIEHDLTMTQLIGLILSYSNALPLRNRLLFDLHRDVKNLKIEVDNLKTDITRLNTTLNETRNNLITCESDREILQVKLKNIDDIRRKAEELYSASTTYLLTGFTVVLAVNAMLGFLVFRISSKKRTR